MTEQEILYFLNVLNQYKEKLSKNKKAAKKFLVDAGIYSENGNLKRNYKHLCIPQEQV